MGLQSEYEEDLDTDGLSGFVSLVFVLMFSVKLVVSSAMDGDRVSSAVVDVDRNEGICPLGTDLFRPQSHFLTIVRRLANDFPGRGRGGKGVRESESSSCAREGFGRVPPALDRLL